MRRFGGQAGVSQGPAGPAEAAGSVGECVAGAWTAVRQAHGKKFALRTSHFALSIDVSTSDSSLTPRTLTRQGLCEEVRIQNARHRGCRCARHQRCGLPAGR